MNVTNPTPTTTSISPTSKNVGDPQFSMTVNGTNFVNGSTVNFNGSARTTSYGSSTQLTATILATDLLVATTTAQITVVTSAPGGGTSNAQTFTVIASAPTVNISASSTAITLGNSSQLTWTSTDATSCTASGDWSGSKATNSSEFVTPLSTGLKTYTLSCTGPGGSASSSATVNVTNPTPVISSISPSSKNVGDPQFTLTITGTGMIASSAVQVNGSDRVTSYASSTVVTAVIPASDLLASTTLLITVTNPAPDGGVSNSKNLTVSPGAIVPTKFVITSATNGTIDLSSYVTIEAQNAAGVLATTYQQDVTLVTNNSATGGGLVNIINGVGTTTISDNVVENVHLSLSDTQSTGLTATSTADISFGPGATKNLSITSSTTAMTAGTRLSIAIARQDRLGNTVTAGSESFYLYSDSTGAKKFYNLASGGAIITEVLIPNNYSSATVWYYDDKTGTPRVTVSDAYPTADGGIGVSDATVDLNVTSDVTSGFVINTPGNLIAGQRLAYEVSRRDQFGNVANSDSVTVYLYHSPFSTSTLYYNAASGGSTLTSLSIGVGIATSTFWLYADKTGSLTVTASDNSLVADGSAGINDASDSFTVNPAAAATLTLNNPGNMTVGTRLGYTVSRYDSYGNTVTTGDLIVNISHDATGTSTVFYNLSSGGITITSVTIADGAYSNDFWFYTEDAGNYNVTASDGPAGLTDATDPVTVNIIPIVPFKIVILNPASPTANVGSTTPIHIQVQDVSGNLDTAYNGSVTLHSNGNSTPGAIGTTVNIIGGEGSVNILDIKAELVSLTLSNPSTALDVSSTKSITFIPGPTAKFILSGANSSLAGERTQQTIVRKDQYDNQITSGVDSVYLYNNAPIGTANFYNAATAGTQITSTSILNGFASTDVWFSGIRSGSWVIDASDNGDHADADVGVNDATSSIAISPSTTALLTLSDPGDIFNGTRAGYVGTRFDAFGNEVTSGTANYFLSSNAGGASTTFYLLASGGSSITELNFSEGNSQANFWYYETKNGIWTVYLSDNSGGTDGSIGIIDGEDSITVSAVPIVATKFIIVTDSTALTGSPLTVVVRAVNNAGDIDTTYQHDVTLNSSGLSTGDGLVDIVNGVGQLIIQDASEETVNLTLTDSEHTGLNVSDSQTVIFSRTVVFPSGGGGGGGYFFSSISFVGRAFPQANLEIIAIQDGQVPLGGKSSVSSGGNFTTNFNGQLPSSANTFALVVYDKNNRIAQTKLFKLGFNDKLASTIFMAPTVSLKQQSVTRGVFMGIEGSAMPNYKIEMVVDGIKAAETTTALGNGSYSINFNTYRLALGEHTLRVRQTDGQGNSSDYSIEKNFKVIKAFVPKADLNNDGKIDVTDWGIFMARYNSPNITIRQQADLNGDSKVDATDLNMFMGAIAR